METAVNTNKFAHVSNIEELRELVAKTWKNGVKVLGHGGPTAQNTYTLKVSPSRRNAVSQELRQFTKGGYISSLKEYVTITIPAVKVEQPVAAMETAVITQKKVSTHQTISLSEAKRIAKKWKSVTYTGDDIILGQRNPNVNEFHVTNRAVEVFERAFGPYIEEITEDFGNYSKVDLGSYNKYESVHAGRYYYLRITEQAPAVEIVDPLKESINNIVDQADCLDVEKRIALTHSLYQILAGREVINWRWRTNDRTDVVIVSEDRWNRHVTRHYTGKYNGWVSEQWLSRKDDLQTFTSNLLRYTSK